MVISTVSLRLPVGQLQLDFHDVYLSAGTGSHRIGFRLRSRASWLNADDPASNAPALLFGAVWTTRPSFRWLGGMEPTVYTLRGYTAPEECTLSLTDEELVALERERADGDVELLIKLRATLLTPTPGVHPVAEDDVTFRIPRLRWQELLDQAGTEVGILVRVRSPLDGGLPAGDSADAATLSKAAARLREARTELHNHQWEQSVASCRKVLEVLGRLVNVPSAKAVSSVPPQRRNQDQRWAAIFHAVVSMAAAAHHFDETTEHFVWTRSEAEAVLASTAALLARYTA